MKLERYAFVRMKNGGKGVLGVAEESEIGISAEKNKGRIVAVGNVYGREGFNDGSCIRTSVIKEIKDGYAYTYSGSKYKLGEKNHDYAKFEDAIRRGIPILDDWSVVVDKKMDVCVHGTIRETKEPFKGKVISQDGPILTFSDGYRVFVDWIATDGEQLAYIAFAVKMGIIQGRSFCQIGIEPYLLKEDWDFVNEYEEYLNSK